MGEEYEGLRELAQSQMMEAALPLVAECAGRNAGFPGDLNELEALVEEIKERKPDLALSVAKEQAPELADDFGVWVSPTGYGALHFVATFPPRGALLADIWPGGSVTGSAVSMGVAVSSPSDREPSPPPEPEPEIPRFSGTELLRVMQAPDDGDSALQFMTVELYADGVIVRYIERADRPFDPESALRRLAPPGTQISPEALGRLVEQTSGGFAGGSVWFEGDLGTEYQWVGGGGGDEVTRSEAEFIPAAPAGAQVLRLCTESRSVEVRLAD